MKNKSILKHVPVKYPSKSEKNKFIGSGDIMQIRKCCAKTNANPNANTNTNPSANANGIKSSKTPSPLHPCRGWVGDGA